MTGIFFGKVCLLTGAHWTMHFYLSDLFCQAAGGVCLSVCLPFCQSIHALQASLYACVSLNVYACVCTCGTLPW